MKKILFALFILSATHLFAQNDITMTDGTWSTVLSQAKQENKPIFIDCYTSWCGPCKWMAKNVFTNDTVAKFMNSHFINYKMDMEKGEGPDFAKKYMVNAYPTFIFFDANGNPMHRTLGSTPAQSFLQWAEASIDTTKALYPLQTKYNSGSRNPELLYYYALNLSEIEDPAATEVADEYFKTLSTSDLLSQKTWDAVNTFNPNINSYIITYMVNHKADYVKQYSEAGIDSVLSNSAIATMDNASVNGDSTAFFMAKDFIAKNGTADAKSESATMTLNYYLHKKNLPEYVMLAKQYATTYFANDANGLNNIAWGFYEHVSNKTDLANAAVWAEKSIQLDNKYYNTDTYANVLFKLGRIPEAKAAAEKAIDLAKQEQQDFSSTQDLLDKINATPK
jgi:thiol-disulfide isomerase/thioredoxin